MKKPWLPLIAAVLLVPLVACADAASRANESGDQSSSHPAGGLPPDQTMQNPGCCNGGG